MYKDTDTEIAYQNKDIVAKLFGERMKGKTLSLFGLESNLKVVDVKPTNLPVVRAKELRMDNLFELEDGSVAILDYESVFKKENFIKYGRYIMDVSERYLREGKDPDIHMIVLYTADIENVEAAFVKTACRIKAEAAYLVGVPSKEWLGEIKKSLSEGMITDEILMRLILLPLTYKGEERKQKAIQTCVELAIQIPDKAQETFALAGILSFTDKVINEETRRYIKEVLGMTQIGMMLVEEGIQKGMREEATQTAINMLKSGKFSFEEIRRYVPRLSIDEIQEIARKMETV